MKLSLSIVTLALLTGATGAHAQRALVMGDGNELCATWIKESASARNGVASTKYIGMAAWVSGYLSGVNSTYATLAAPDPEDLLLESRVTPQEILEKIGDYCAANPGATLFRAGDALVVSLQNRLLRREFLQRHYPRDTAPPARAPNKR